MRRAHVLVSCCALAAVGCQSKTPTNFTTGGADNPAEKGKTYKWSFDSDAAGSPPKGFVSALGNWVVQAEPTAPSAPNVLRQTGAFKNPDFPLTVVADLSFTDLTVRVR